MKLNKIILVLSLFLLPIVSFGAVVSVESRGVLPSVGDTAIFDVYLNTEGQTINTVDGSIKIIDQDRLALQNYFVANSILSLWPTSPTFNSKDRGVSFVGGTPGGVKTSHGLLFSLVFSAKSSGDIVFRPQKTVIYSNEAKATSIIAENKDLSFSISENGNVVTKNNWQELIEKDKTSPQPFTVTLNQDPNLFEGQKFISFTTSDDGTGIAYYEVREGNFPPEKAETQYVLQDQQKIEKIEVIAYDRAGNKRIGTLQDQKNSLFLDILWLILILVIVRLIWLVYNSQKKLEKNGLL